MMMMMMMHCLRMLILLVLTLPLLEVTSFHIPHTRHHHPVYVQYRNEQQQQHQLLERDTSSSSTASSSYNQDQQSYLLDISLDDGAPLETSISTPISYDDETGMVQTAVRAIVQHPTITTLVDNSVVGLSSTLVISLGAVHELVDCFELEWTHHATSSTEGLAILSLGHFLHYGRETIKQLMEMQDNVDDDVDDDDDDGIINKKRLPQKSRRPVIFAHKS